jgi:hypothetical protein
MENTQGLKIGNVGEIGRDRESKTLPVSTLCYFAKPAPALCQKEAIRPYPCLRPT